MTRKDFELLATAINQFHWQDEVDPQWFAQHLAAFLKRENPRFDSERFIDAATAGYTPKVAPDAYAVVVWSLQEDKS